MEAHESASAEAHSRAMVAHSRVEEPHYRAMKAHFGTRWVILAAGRPFWRPENRSRSLEAWIR
jgi:hypothetical protein